MNFLNPKDTALKWDFSECRVHSLCVENGIIGVQHVEKSWSIPKDAPKPVDE
ncbi:MAG: hypothetical protein BWX85_00067 [Chloroflexi bacterium ADurb.Bin120]|jgi:hypothetical protein|nr:MAG: hypothetical protein BWX85_00067 [Chloroflexi bacterium ADurb.Bin120]